MVGALWRPWLLGIMGLGGVAAVLGGARALHAPVAPPPGLWMVLIALAPVQLAEVVIPASAAIAMVVPLSRWRRQGTWSGARASGVAGRRLAGPALLAGLVAALLTAGFTLEGAPAARRLGARLQGQLVQVTLWPGRTTHLGSLDLHPLEEGSGVLVESGSALGIAREVRLVSSDGEPRVELSHGWLDLEEVELGFSRWSLPLPTSERRVELSERTTRELVLAIDRTRASGGDPSYERAVLLKRFLHPLSVLFLPLSLVPLGLGRRPWLSTAGAGLAWLAAVRAGDHLAPILGSWLSASTGLWLVLALVLAGWARWRDR